MIPALVSIEFALTHINAIPEDEAEVERKLWLASQIVANHCKLTEIPAEWLVTDIPLDAQEIALIETEDSPPSLVQVPGNIQTAVLLVAGELFENREASISRPLSEAVVTLLYGFRDPTMA